MSRLVWNLTSEATNASKCWDWWSLHLNRCPEPCGGCGGLENPSSLGSTELLPRASPCDHVGTVAWCCQSFWCFLSWKFNVCVQSPGFSFDSFFSPLMLKKSKENSPLSQEVVPSAGMVPFLSEPASPVVPKRPASRPSGSHPRYLVGRILFCLASLGGRCSGKLFYIILFIHFYFLAVLPLCCCPALSRGSEGVCSPAGTHWLPVAVASLGEHGPEGAGASVAQPSGSAAVAPGL